MPNGDPLRFQQPAGFLAGIQGAQAGISVAQGLERVQAQRQQITQSQQRFALQKSQLMMNRLRDITALGKTNPRIRKAMVELFNKDMARLGNPVSPVVNEILSDPSNDPGLGALVSQFNSAQSAADQSQIGNSIIAQLGTENGVEVITSLQKIQAQTQRQQQLDPFQQQQLIGQEIDRQRQLLGGDFTVIDSANRIKTLAQDPVRRRQAFPADAARTTFAKLIDPKTGVRESEVARITKLTGGLLDQAVLALKKAARGEQLDEGQWSQLVQVSKALSERSEGNINRSRQSVSQRLGMRSADLIFGSFVQPIQFDFSTFAEKFRPKDEQIAERPAAPRPRRPEPTVEERQAAIADIQRIIADPASSVSEKARAQQLLGRIQPPQPQVAEQPVTPEEAQIQAIPGLGGL